MKTVIKSFLTLLAGAIIALAGAWSSTLYHTAETLGASGAPVPALLTATTSSAVAVTTSTRILATTTNPLDPNNSYTRVYTSICNPNANPVALNLDSDLPANQPLGRTTVFIAAAAGYDACYEITERNPYQGSITASSTNQTSTIINVKDYVSK